MSNIERRLTELERKAAMDAPPGFDPARATADGREAWLDDFNRRWLSGEPFDPELTAELERLGMLGPDGERRPFRRPRLVELLAECAEESPATE